jgi:hypothetical protein
MKSNPASVLLMLIATIMVLALFSNVARNLDASETAFRCEEAALYFPANGVVGWKYQDPASTDRDSQSNLTIHAGLDIFAAAGDGSLIFAPADGLVSREPDSDSVNLVLSDVTNVARGGLAGSGNLTQVSDQAFKDRPSDPATKAAHRPRCRG